MEGLRSPSPGPSPLRSSCLDAYRPTLLLAYQSFGVVYGDLSISPIYVYRNTFSGKLRYYEDDVEILGILSLVIWSLTLIPLCKYIIFVLGADNDGEGGTFALYSLLCRNTRIGLNNTPSASTQHQFSHNTDASHDETRTSLMIKKFFEKNEYSRIVLLLFVLLGTGMVVGDGILTPTMSVLSAVSGIRIKVPHLQEGYTVVISCVILIVLFALQRRGTRRVGFLFAPILIAWLVSICLVGIYNIFKWNPNVFRALSPYYIYYFFKKVGKRGWSSLGGVVLSITGGEAMFADLGHFSKISIRIAFTAVVYPCLVIAYMGEAAYLTMHKEDLHGSFYKAIPEPVFWPIFVTATLATVVASQAIISATFSLISQCSALGCFPRVKILHTSNHIHGQIYIPEVNWLLMCICILVALCVQDTTKIGNAYGLAVITVMFVTTCLMFLIITIVWKKSIILATLFVIAFGSLEILYLSACLAKIPHGGWLPLVLSFVTLFTMSVWYYGTCKKQVFEVENNKLSIDPLLTLMPILGMTRLPGIVLVYSNTVTGIPPVFAHFIMNFPAIQHVLVFVCQQSLTVPKVPPDEQFLLGRVGSADLYIFRCIVRYGYKDARLDIHAFENRLISKMAEFLQHEDELGSYKEQSIVGENSNKPADESRSFDELKKKKVVRFTERSPKVSNEVRVVVGEKENGVTYMIGNTHVAANADSPLLKKIAISVYGFLRRNSRQPAVALGLPHASLIEVGMMYHL